MPWIARRITIIRRTIFVTAAPRAFAPPSLWERTPKFVLCLLAVACMVAGKLAADALRGGPALEVALGAAGGLAGWYGLKFVPLLARLFLLAAALALMIALGVWLARLIVQGR